MGFEITKEASTKFVEGLNKCLEEEDIGHFYSAFAGHFKNESSFRAYLKDLHSQRSNISRLGFFYYVLTREIGHAGIVLVGIFSIMEATASEKFQPFDQWLLAKVKNDDISYPIVSRDNFKETILLLQDEYFKEHGSTMRVRSFINKYFSKDDKQKLTHGFDVRNKKFNYKALELDKKVKCIVEVLYAERNAFVHAGRLPQITECRGRTLIYSEMKGTYIFREISIEEIKKMFERAFVKFIKNKRLTKTCTREQEVGPC